MRIALVHDYLKEYGGAESVFETLSDIFPQAELYTSIYHPQSLGPHRARLEKKWSHRLHTSFLQHIPFSNKLISPLRLLSPLAFRFLKIENCDFIISSATGAYFPNSLNKGGAKLICYCHTPPRYLYGYPTARRVTNPILLTIVDLLNHFLRLLDYKYSQNVDQYIANSQEVQKRIQKFYRRDSIVIYPPIYLPTSSTRHPEPASPAGGLVSGSTPYYLAGGRLAHAKRFDLAIQAAIQLKLNLKIFGRDFGGNLATLQQLSQGHPNIQFLGEVTQEERYQLLAGGTALINPGRDEDFGMLNVEAMSFGCPVIAHNSGGPKESILSGQTGLLFDDHSVSGLVNAIKDFQKLKISRQFCQKHAQQFGQDVFIQKIQKLVQSLSN